MTPVRLPKVLALSVGDTRPAFETKQILPVFPITVNPAVDRALTHAIPITGASHPSRHLLRGVALCEPVKNILLQRWIIFDETRVCFCAFASITRLCVRMRLVILLINVAIAFQFARDSRAVFAKRPRDRGR